MLSLSTCAKAALNSQGKWAEAGKELDEIQGLVQK
jgi:hypothetical protein